MKRADIPEAQVRRAWDLLTRAELEMKAQGVDRLADPEYPNALFGYIDRRCWRRLPRITDLNSARRELKELIAQWDLLTLNR